MLNSMHKKRLLKLATLLESVPRKQFDMSWWLTEAGNDVQIVPMPPKEVPCGYAACAGGWACSDKGFRKAGLHFNHRAAPAYGVYEDFDALRVFFFGEDWHYRSLSDWLFSGHDNHQTPKQVAKNIRKIVDGWIPKYLESIYGL